MNTQQFEAAIQNRFVLLKSTMQLNALLFTSEYEPEEFVKKMNAPGNASQFVDKLKVGLGKWKYSSNTLTGGYIWCAVSDEPTMTTGGNEMGNIKEYFDIHPDQRMLLKYGIIFGASLGVVYLTYELSSGLISPEFVTLVPIAIAFLNEKVKPLDPNKPWAIIGAAPKRKRK